MKFRSFQTSTSKDFFEDSLLTVRQWVGSDPLKWASFYEAVLSLDKSDSCGIYDHRLEPYVGYDIVQDITYFIFKIDHGGYCYISAPEAYSYYLEDVCGDKEDDSLGGIAPNIRKYSYKMPPESERKAYDRRAEVLLNKGGKSL